LDSGVAVLGGQTLRNKHSSASLTDGVLVPIPKHMG
jgi:hypothetical protein